MARGVDQVDLDVAELDRSILGEHGDTALTLQLIGIHDEGAGRLGVPKDHALLQQSVDEGRLAVVDVGDDGDVSQVMANGLGAGGCCFNHSDVQERVAVNRHNAGIAPVCPPLGPNDDPVWTAGTAQLLRPDRMVWHAPTGSASSVTPKPQRDLWTMR